MARSLFNVRSVVGLNRAVGFQGRYRPEFGDDPAAGRRADPAQRRLPWIFWFLGYHLMAAFGIAIAFVAWLILMATH
jgi:hypothetical protein